MINFQYEFIGRDSWDINEHSVRSYIPFELKFRLPKLRKERNLTLLLVSHDLNIVYKYAETVLCINKVAVCFGQPGLVLKPEDLSALYGGEAEFYKHSH